MLILHIGKSVSIQQRKDFLMVKRKERSDWPKQLREAIKASNRPEGNIADAAGVQRSQLARFMQGAGISLDTAGLLAQELGLTIRRGKP